MSDVYTEQEMDFVSSFKALCKRYNVNVSWHEIDNANFMDYMIEGENISIPMATVIYGDVEINIK